MYGKSHRSARDRSTVADERVTEETSWISETGVIEFSLLKLGESTCPGLVGYGLIERACGSSFSASVTNRRVEEEASLFVSDGVRS